MSNRAFTSFSRTSYATPASALGSWYSEGNEQALDRGAGIGGTAGHATAAVDARLAIVGGGAAAVAALVAWQQQPRGQRPALLWIAPAGATGAGVAYATPDPQHRLNVRARRMSVLESEPDDFVEFLALRDGHADTEGFYPRADYGDYLHARLRAVLEEEDCSVWRTELIGARERGGTWELTGADGGRRRVHALLLAPGALAARCLRGVAQGLVEAGRYQVDPWQFTRSAGELPRQPDVVIVGSGLTAVDLALTAARRYPDARIQMLSRHGRLPATQSRAGPLPPAQTATLLAAMEAQPRLCEWLRTLRAAMRAAPDWRSVMESIRHESSRLWQLLTGADRARFLRHLRAYWDSARHRMAPEIDAQLRRLMAVGRLRVCSGRLLSVRAADAGAVVIAWQPRGSEITRLQRAELVLQACGLETRIAATASPLIVSLLDTGSARVDALGLGLSVDSDNALVDAHGHPQSAWLLGALALGSLWECTAMPDIREQAARVIGAVCARVGPAPMTARWGGDCLARQ